MPTFTRPAAAAVSGFTLRAVVTEATAGQPVVELNYSLAIMDSDGVPLGYNNGDLAPYLTQAQVNAFTAAALQLYAKAKAELLT